jgi:hypothetical protein
MDMEERKCVISKKRLTKLLRLGDPQVIMSFGDQVIFVFLSHRQSAMQMMAMR